MIRFFLNCQYSILSGRQLRFGSSFQASTAVFAISRRRGDLVTIDGDVAIKNFITEVESLIKLVMQDKVYPFIREDHASIIQVQNDATLRQNGMYLELTEAARAAGAEAPWGEEHSYAFGQLLPDVVLGYDMEEANSGVAELAGLWCTFASIHNTPHLRELFGNKYVVSLFPVLSLMGVYPCSG